MSIRDTIRESASYLWDNKLMLIGVVAVTTTVYYTHGAIVNGVRELGRHCRRRTDDSTKEK